MAAKPILSVAGVLTFALGISWLIAPEFMLEQWGITGNAAAAYMGRRYGGLFFGYAAILWFARASGPSPSRHAIVTGSFVVTTVLAAVSLLGILGGTLAAAAWGAFAIEAGLAAAFGYLLLTERP